MIPTLGSIVVGDDLTVEVPVDDLGGNAAVRVDYAVGATVPGETSRLWRAIDTVETIGSVVTNPQIRGTTVWIRASGRTLTGIQTSAFTDAVYVEIPDWADFLSLTAVLEDNVPVIAWTPGTLTEGVRILWDVHPVGEGPGSFASSEDYDADALGAELSIILAAGEAITLEIQAWDGWDSGLQQVDGELGQTVTRLLERRLVTLEADELILTAANNTRWRVTADGSGGLDIDEVT